jgi:hypothetical protein
MLSDDDLFGIFLIDIAPHKIIFTREKRKFFFKRFDFLLINSKYWNGGITRF